jgi:hypothetical protein
MIYAAGEVSFRVAHHPGTTRKQFSRIGKHIRTTQDLSRRTRPRRFDCTAKKGTDTIVVATLYRKGRAHYLCRQ